MKRNFRLAFVSRPHAVAQMLQTIAPTMGLTVEIHLEAMEQAVTLAKKLFDNGMEAIIGCGDTGKMLQQSLESPIITIADSPLAILYALKKAKKYANTILLPFYKNIPEGIDILADALQLRLIPGIFQDMPSLVFTISSHIKDGIKCIVGSNIAVQIANAQGCPGVEILYREQEIRLALEEAMLLSEVHEKKDIQSAFLESIAESYPDKGLLCVNNNDEIVLLNSRAISLLKCEDNQARNTRITLQDVGIKESFRNKGVQEHAIIKCKKGKIYSTIMPVYLNETLCGSFAVLQPVTKPDFPDKSSGFKSIHTFDDIVGNSPAMNKLRQQAMVFARTDASLLIQGETGTGKELLAHSIHNASLRCNAPFVAINCAALTESLLESELFGYEEGAFTGAKRGGKDGIFALANGGTVFLDEIADVSPALQVRLLRVLEAKEIIRVGGDKVIPVDARVISSSWKKLANEVRSGRFRADLYYRLSILALTLPPLTERLEDIPFIVDNIIKRRKMRGNCLSQHALALMSRYSWPGNIRELDALLQRYSLLLQSTGPDDELFEFVFNSMAMESEDIFHKAVDAQPRLPENEQPGEQSTEIANIPEGTLKRQMDFYESEVIKRSLEKYHYNKIKTAKSLGISPNTLWRKMKGLASS